MENKILSNQWRKREIETVNRFGYFRDRVFRDNAVSQKKNILIKITQHLQFFTSES